MAPRLRRGAPRGRLDDLLRPVSRSFYLSLRILPSGLREPIGLAYLLARAADTVADTRLLPRAERLSHLETLRAACAGSPADVGALMRACAAYQSNDAERRLLERVDQVIGRLRALSEADRSAVRSVVETLTSGMVFDLTRFPGEDAGGLAALDTLEELDHYTYLVAGCVGPFWTALHVAHRPRLAGWNLAERSTQGVRFGKALQMTNVLRDAPRDLRAGRCYLPARELASLGLAPHDLLDPARTRRARPLVLRLIALTLEHYDVAWRYTMAIPRVEWRMRLACAWPLSIGLGTLALLARHPDPLGVAEPIKVSRGWVRALIARSLVTVWSNAALGRQSTRLRSAVALG
ncbi:MAG TPA: phytoene/squalene synthase family protein [Candidatus Acidoferrum sp.]|nr:phytoene/squalene synthase family protein [Candidatus Acidoferrum sp.]